MRKRGLQRASNLGKVKDLLLAEPRFKPRLKPTAEAVSKNAAEILPVVASPGQSRWWLGEPGTGRAEGGSGVPLAESGFPDSDRPWLPRCPRTC